MATLNGQQVEIVRYVREETGSAIVLARAGCGKTYTLVEGVIREIVDSKLGSGVIMAFNKSAANEFEARIERMGAQYTVFDSGTVHSLGFGAWRRNRRCKVEQYKISNLVRERQKDGNIYETHWSAIIKLVSMAKQSGIGITCQLDDVDEWQELINHYDIDCNGSADAIVEAAIVILEASNRQLEIIDFDDMIYLPLLFNSSLPQYDFVLIDEAQDTNVVRRMLAMRMLKAGGRMIAVGDDKQAIYGFTGANSNSLELIQQELNAVVLPLTITYRCPKAVVAEANKLVPDMQAHESAPAGIVRRIPAVSEIQN